MMELILFALAAWTITYGLSLSSLCETMRRWVGIGYDFDKDGNVIDRWAMNGLGRLLNCPPCTGFWATVLVVFIGLLGGALIIEFLATVGIVLLIARWWMTRNVRKEWWL